MLFSQAGKNSPRRAGLAVSAAAHAALLLLVLMILLHMGRVRAVYRDSRCCTAALSWTGRTAGSAVSAAAPRDRPRKAPVVTPTHSARIQNPERRRQQRRVQKEAPAAQKRLAQAGTSSPQQQPTYGTGAGPDDAEPAFPTFYPAPPVSDRTLLPAAERKIIVNVSISAQGEVTDETLIEGLGNALDQIVLDTVKSWRFHPATLNGTAVASAEQLVFPFSRKFGRDTGTDSS